MKERRDWIVPRHWPAKGELDPGRLHGVLLEESPYAFALDGFRPGLRACYYLLASDRMRGGWWTLLWLDEMPFPVCAVEAPEQGGWYVCRRLPRARFSFVASDDFEPVRIRRFEPLRERWLSWAYEHGVIDPEPDQFAEQRASCESVLGAAVAFLKD